MFESLITTYELSRNLNNPNWVVLDCRYNLANPEEGQNDYILAHIPGAVYVHLDRDLSGRKVPGRTGRHPLPEPKDAAAFFAKIGISNQSQVVAYDAAGGAIAAVRAWWMLRWLGHTSVAVLDGGWQKWLLEKHPISAGKESLPPAQFLIDLHPEWVIEARPVQALVAQPEFKLLDSRSSDRYRGENETIDPVAGHIPGAKSAPYSENLNPDGTFLTKEALQSRFEPILGDSRAKDAVFYCGSGVTAAHNILAMFHAGMGMAKLYAGSWSEWITDPTRPVEK